MPELSYPALDPDDEVSNISPNIIDDQEPRFYGQAISRPNIDIWQAAIWARMDTLPHNHTCDVVHRVAHKKI
jgi:hypothetical protein